VGGVTLRGSISWEGIVSPIEESHQICVPLPPGWSQAEADGARLYAILVKGSSFFPLREGWKIYCHPNAELKPGDLAIFDNTIRDVEILPDGAIVLKPLTPTTTTVISNNTEGIDRIVAIIP